MSEVVTIVIPDNLTWGGISHKDLVKLLTDIKNALEHNAVILPTNIQKQLNEVDINLKEIRKSIGDKTTKGTIVYTIDEIEKTIGKNENKEVIFTVLKEIREKLNLMDTTLNSLESEVGGITTQLTTIDTKIVELEANVDSIDQRVTDIESKI